MNNSISLLRNSSIFIGLLLFSNLGFANDGNTVPLDAFLKTFDDAASQWVSLFSKVALNIFWILAITSLVWTFGTMAMKGAEIQAFFTEFVKFMMVVGFFWFLLTHAHTIVQSISAGFDHLGSRASKGGVSTPGGVLKQGFMLSSKLLDSMAGGYVSEDAGKDYAEAKGVFQTIIAVGKEVVRGVADVSVGTFKSIMNLPSNLLIYFATIVITFTYSMIAVEMFIAKMSILLVGYMGMFVLGFGGSKWTSDMAIGYYKTVIAQATYYLTLLLVVAVGSNIVDNFYESQTPDELYIGDVFVIITCCSFLYMLSKRLPPIVSGLIQNTGLNHSNAGATAGGLAVAAAAGAVGMTGLAASALRDSINKSPSTASDQGSIEPGSPGSQNDNNSGSSGSNGSSQNNQNNQNNSNNSNQNQGKSAFSKLASTFNTVNSALK